MNDRTNAERQRRYVQRLKDRAATPHSPDMVLAALANLQPIHLRCGLDEVFARTLMAEAARLCPTANATCDIASSVSNDGIAAPIDPELLAEWKKACADVVRGEVGFRQGLLMKAKALLDMRVAGLQKIIKGFREEGSKHVAAASPGSVGKLAHELEVLLYNHEIIPKSRYIAGWEKRMARPPRA
jgi:hypothetical protein